MIVLYCKWRVKDNNWFNEIVFRVSRDILEVVYLDIFWIIFEM